MSSMRLTCILLAAGMLGAGAISVACTQQTAAAPSQGGDDDDDDTTDDDDDTAAGKVDGGGSSSGSSSSSSSSSSGGAPVDSGPPPKSALTFFVSSVAGGTGGNLGGLTGADKKCQDLATAVQAGDHKWAAFLSAQGTNAKDRIGKGPWKNQKGEVVATDVESLLSTQNGLKDSLFIDEKGAVVPAEGRYVLTGSLANGTPNGNKTCQNWASNQQNQTASFGDTTPSANPNIGANWAFAKNNAINGNTSNCTAQGLTNAKSQGRIFCFATD